jgi:hypothetical protein
MDYQIPMVGELTRAPELPLLEKIFQYIEFHKEAKRSRIEVLEHYPNQGHRIEEIKCYIKALEELATWLNRGAKINDFSARDKDREVL